MKFFPEILEELMKEQSIDVKSLAENLDSSASIIHRWLKGNLGLLLPTAIKIANFFNCSLDYLFGRSEDHGNGSYQECPQFDIQFKKVLKELQISQNKLLNDKVIARGNLNCWLNKKQTPHIESIIKLADYLKVSIDYLVGREK